MPTTPKYSLRYPQLSDPVNIPQDLQNLATDVEGVGTRADDWAATTAYKAGQVVRAPDGRLVRARADFTSGASFAVANWDALSSTSPATRAAVLYGGMPTVNPNVSDYLTLNAKTAPRSLDLLMMFNGWAGPLVFSGQEGYADTLGAQMIIAWQPSANVQGTTNTGTLSNVATGILDTYLDAQIATVKAYNKPIIVRLAHEFNGNWTTYGNTKETAAQFITGWKYIVDRFRNAGVTNVLWCWSPSCWGRAASGPIIDATPFYPGDDYVDLLGLDGYQNKLNPVVDWPKDVFLANYKQLTAMTNKPIIIAEVGVAEDARFAKKDWYSQLFALIRDQMPRCVGVCVWTRTDAIGTEGDYSLDSSGTNTAALTAFKTGVNSIPMAVPSRMTTAGWLPHPNPSPPKSSYGAYSSAWAPNGTGSWTGVFNIKEENIPRGAAAASDFTLTSGTMAVFAGPTMRAGETYSKAAIDIGAPGATTPTHTWIALMDQSLNVLAKSTDFTGAVGGTQLFGFTFSAISRPMDTPLYFGVVSVAATPFGLRGGLNGSQVLLGVNPRMTGFSTTGLTDPTSLGATAAALTTPTTQTVLPWCAIG